MTRILVIDDQAQTDRYPIFKLALEGHDVTYLTSFPTAWSIFEGFQAISWDNDLGNGVDVVEKLTGLFWRNPGLFTHLFSQKTHLIHTANVVAQMRLFNLFNDMAAYAECSGIKVHMLPIGQDYNAAQINRCLAL
jgi:hypothetical protein